MAFADHVTDDAPQVFPIAWRQHRGRLIKNQYPCRGGERAGKLDLLALGDAKRADHGVGRKVEVIAVEDFGGIAAQPLAVDQAVA
jgi:hypothetical protein